MERKWCEVTSLGDVSDRLVESALVAPEIAVVFRYQRPGNGVIAHVRNYNLDSQKLTKMKTPLRIAVLECDTPPADIVAKYGRYGRIFKTLLEAAAEGLGLSPEQDLELSAYDVVTAQEYPDLEKIDAVLISGSSMFSSSC